MTQNTNTYYTYANLNDLNYLDTNYTNTTVYTNSTGYWRTIDTYYPDNYKVIYNRPSEFLRVMKNTVRGGCKKEEEKVDLDDWM